MVEEFLRKEYENHLENKLNLSTKRDELQSNIKEHTRFIEVLSNNNESYFTEFTPRDLAFRNNDKIDELKEELESLKIDLDNIEVEIANENKKIEELQVVMDECKNSRKQKVEIDYSLDDSVGTLERILTYLPADPMRARVEIQALINSKKSENS